VSSIAYPEAGIARKIGESERKSNGIILEGMEVLKPTKFIQKRNIHGYTGGIVFLI